MNKTINYFVLLWQFYLRATRTTAFLSKESWSRRFQKSAVCQHTFKTMQLCQNAIFSITGADRQNFNSVMTKNLIHNNKVIIFQFFFFFFFFFQSVLSIIEGHFPAGTSVNTLAQFAQGYNAGENISELIITLPRTFN